MIATMQVDRQTINNFHSSVALIGVCTILDVWHARLGHPFSHITKSVIKSFNLPVSGSLNFNSVCQSYLIGKAKQLPFGDSSSVMLPPLVLIYSDVLSLTYCI